MAYWLFKSEPSTFGIDHLSALPKQTDHWDGVRNYQARNMLRDQIKQGDQVFFYHSNCDIPGIVGTAKVVKSGYVDHTQFDPESGYYDPKATVDKPRWYMVDVQFVKKFKAVIPLTLLKTLPALENMPLVQKGNRLSVMPVSQAEWDVIMAL